jgi:predicted esterase
MKRILLLLLCTLCVQFVFSQAVPFPTGPRDNNKFEPWGYDQVGTTWNTSAFLPFIYQNRWLRLMPPNGVTYNSGAKTWTFSEPGKKYPLILFFHGRGEQGTDNNNQLKHGGERHKNAVLNNTFPGFLLYPQSATIQQAKGMVDKLIAEFNVDPDQIYVHGLSNGGSDTWKFLITYPTMVAAGFPMSASDDLAKTENLLYTPIRQAQGGLDTNPAPHWTQTIVDWFNNSGGHLEYFYLPTAGHSTWNTMYNRSDFFSWFLSHKKNKIFVRYKRNELCESDIVSVVMGLTPGFQAYEWRKNSVLIPGATSYKITATEYGSYTARFQRSNGVWSQWSDPVEVKLKAPTVTPPIQLVALQSLVIPDVNGNSNINLTLPDGFETYTWNKSDVAGSIGNSQTIIVNQVGTYTAVVKEFGGCSSTPSQPLKVVDANGPVKPDPISNLQVTTVSKTELRLNWENNISPTVNEAGFEIYRSTESEGVFELIAVTTPDVLTYADKNLPSNTSFWYKIRPISGNGSADVSAAVSGLTDVDVTPPTPPNNLTVTSINQNSIGLSWSASTDDVAVSGYEVYLKTSAQTQYIKAYSTTATSQTVFQLQANTLYNFIVKAKDEAGNFSSSSQQVVVATVFQGLTYQYFHGAWNTLPDFSSLTPQSTGTVNNFSITPRTQSDNIGFSYSGTIYLPNSATNGTPGQYTFYLTSDDGSKLWINNTLVIDHDGIHGATEKGGSITLAPGYYPIKVDYFEKTGSSEKLEVRWQGPSISKQLIPNIYLRENFAFPTAPANPPTPTLTVLSYNSIRVNWTAYTGTGTAFEVYRSTNNSTWSIIATVPTTESSFTDVRLNASTRYYYRLRAINSGNISSYTASVNSTTQSLPALPVAPSNLQVISFSTNSATITWNDNSTNEANFEIYKATGTNASFVKVGTVNANVTTFTDNSLFAHTKYFYKVNSRNVRGASTYSNEAQFTSLNTSPTLASIAEVKLHYDDESTILLSASDIDNDLIIIGSNNLPAFIHVFDYGDGTGQLYIDPSESDQGEYSGLQVFAKDQFGGIQTVEFKVIVNDNHAPVVNTISPLSVKESYVGKVTLTGSDTDNDEITWTFQNAPAFMATSINGNTIDLTFKPGLSHAGNYNVSVIATDPDGSSHSAVLNLTVTDFDPNFKVLANFRRGTGANGPAPWNNIGPGSSLTSYNNLLRDNNTNSGIGLIVENAWSDADINGASSPAASLNIPSTVSQSFFWHQQNTARTLKITGLNPDGKYNLKFFPSRNIDGTANRNTMFSVPGFSPVSVQANNNTSVTADFNGVIPSAQGEVVVSVSIGAGSSFAILNALIIESYYDGNTLPEAPSDLVVSIAAPGPTVKLAWLDNASNELSFEVFRSTNNVDFSKIATLSMDATTYNDAQFSSGVTYYYQVRAVNGIGASSYSNTVSIVAPNRAPVISPIGNITIPEDGTKVILVHATDPDNDQIEMSLQNQPHFVSIEYVSNGQSNLNIAPTIGDNGTYSFTLSCIDTKGAESNTTVSVNVTNINERIFKINFTIPTALGAAPWNNVTSTSANSTVANLKDNNNANSTVSLTLVNAWTGTNPNGHTTGNNTGLYPDAVMLNSFYIQDNSTRTVTISGLSPEKLYDFSFFSSRMGVSDVRNIQLTIGSKSVTLNGSNNTSNLGQIISVAPNVNGQLTISILRASGSSFAYLNAMVMREYASLGMPATPAQPLNLISQVLTRSSVKLNWQDASDNETGFEVWRSDGNNAGYVLHATLGSNSTTYTNTGLANSNTYFYKVRAINLAGSSNYTNETSASTFDFSVALNFHAYNGSPAGWNSITTYLPAGSVVNNLTDEFGVNTGISMTVVSEFAGDNPDGMTTGNNSGIVPDQVMQGMWWIDKLTTATLKFSNLSFLRKYNFSFFAARNGAGDRTTVYRINGNSVALNASLNTANIVQIKDILPDSDGTITVDITTTSSAMFGYLNGLIIQAVPNNTAVAGRMNTAQLKEQSFGKSEYVDGEASTQISAYPNPFVDRVTIQLSEKIAENYRVDVMSPSGVVVYSNNFERIKGENEVDVILDVYLPQGVYLLRILTTKGASQNLKLLKK